MRIGVTLTVAAFTLGSCLAAAWTDAPPRVMARRKPAGKPPARAAGTNPEKASFQHQIAPLVAKYCGNCHGEKQQIAGISFAKYQDDVSVLKGRDVWGKASIKLAAEQMPPKGLPQPTAAERALLTTWIDAKLSKADCTIKDPGRVTLRRLNRAEYNNTIRDLLGVDFHPADEFPNDDVGYGFDNIGDVLSISPLLMEKYLAAAEKIVAMAIVTPDAQGPATRFEAEKLQTTASGPVYPGVGRGLFSNGEVYTEFTFPRDGEYLIRARAYGQQAGEEPAKMAFRLDGQDLATVEVTAVEASPQVYETSAQVKAGKRRLAVAFTNDYFNPQAPRGTPRDRNLILHYVEVVGPTQAHPTPPASQKRILIVQPKSKTDHAACARQILARFARRAYRRPVTAAEVDRLVRCVSMAEKEGESFEKGVQLAIEAVLVSPSFLFRVETDPNPKDPKASRLLNDYEIASRLSYFLWSSMPDEPLFAVAAKGRLKRPEVLAAQAARMLKDPKARALTENFAGQWLQLRNLKNVNPDPARFADWNNGLRADMQKETELFFETVVKEDRSVLDFLDGRFTFLNERLAKHYGIDGVKGDQFQRVALSGDQRMGVLTQGSILTITSNPTRTSPVKRGKWILEQILGTPPPPPPPNVPELKDAGGMLTGTLRQRMEQHRKDPGCASCHARLDPLGFGLENYDAVGAWRAKEGDLPIDASGTLPGGKTFQTPAQLIGILKSQKEMFVRTLASFMLTYALGRGMEAYDRCTLDQITANVGKNNYRFSSLVAEIVKSDPFRMRRSEGDRGE
jgi:hypothetical protein